MSRLRPPRDPAEALLWRTRMRLAAVTFVVLATLVLVVGLTAAVTATALMRESIDRALDAAVTDPLTLHELLEEGERFEYAGPLGMADTFVVLADADGNVYGNTTDAWLVGIPDMDAIGAAAAGDDRRSGSYGDTDLRLLTTYYRVAAVEDGSEVEDDRELEGVAASTTLYLQAGHDLSLQQDLERQLLLAISAIGLLGIAAAAVVTIFLTRRAMTPISEAFTTERRFVATASHELRTPIAVIRASAEIIGREGLVAEPGRELLDDIVSETDRMGTLVGDLLALASAQAGAMPLDLRPVELAPYVKDIARRSSSMAESEGVSLETNTAIPASTQIRADRDRLDQTMLILVDNAIKHTPPDGTVHLDATVDSRAGAATLSVTDDGPGIAPEDAERIFQPFIRSGPAAASRKGAGLGLAVARQLAEGHDAQLSVESRAGHGATFRLRIPLWSPQGGASG